MPLSVVTTFETGMTVVIVAVSVVVCTVVEVDVSVAPDCMIVLKVLLGTDSPVDCGTGPADWIGVTVWETGAVPAWVAGQTTTVSVATTVVVLVMKLGVKELVVMVVAALPVPDVMTVSGHGTSVVMTVVTVDKKVEVEVKVDSAPVSLTVERAPASLPPLVAGHTTTV